MTEKIISFNDIHICTESFGDINNPTILLIMGATASMIWWEKEFCKRLSNQGFHVIRYDNREAGGYYWPKMKEHIIELVAAYPVSIAEFAMVSDVEDYVQMAKKALEVQGS